DQNGKLTTTFPDGTTQVIDPDTGAVEVTDPRGRTETVNLDDLNTLPDIGRPDRFDSPGLPDGPDGTGDDDGTSGRNLTFPELNLGGGGGGGSAGGGDIRAVGGGAGIDAAGGGSLSRTAFSSPDLFGTPGGTPGSGGSPDDVLQPFAPSAPGTPGAPGVPGTPGTPMGGMGGMGAGGEKGNGERVRAVLVDAAEESERRNRRRRSPWNRQEDDDTFLAPPSRVSTTGGHSPGQETEPVRPFTSSADYLEEDADVWGTEEGGTPAVIGR
ncbi:hypothetical protein ACFWFH_33100, partial [Streptomyces coelicoflavus]